MKNPVLRDLTVWSVRITECLNPALWLSAINHDRERFGVLQFVSHRPAAELSGYLREIEDDAEFIGEVRANLSRWTAYRPRSVDFMLIKSWGSVFFNEVTLYAIVRAVRPAIMIETGGTPGKSTAFILRAMERNGCGHLYTIDLPPAPAQSALLSEHKSWHQALPTGAASGWVVPGRLRSRHTALLGKSSEQMPLLLAAQSQVDIFLHDSDHSYENMTWEFETVYPKVKPGGLILSDDILDNTSFFDFCRHHHLKQTHVFNLGAARVVDDGNSKI